MKYIIKGHTGIKINMPDGSAKQVNTSSQEYKDLYSNLTSKINDDTYYKNLPEINVISNRAGEHMVRKALNESGKEMMKGVGTAALVGTGIGGLVAAPLPFIGGIAGGMIGDYVTNKATQKFSGGKYQNWGEFAGDKTGISPEVMAFTNPGAIIGGGIGSLSGAIATNLDRKIAEIGLRLGDFNIPSIKGAIKSPDTYKYLVTGNENILKQNGSKFNTNYLNKNHKFSNKGYVYKYNGNLEYSTETPANLAEGDYVDLFLGRDKKYPWREVKTNDFGVHNDYINKYYPNKKGNIRTFLMDSSDQPIEKLVRKEQLNFITEDFKGNLTRGMDSRIRGSLGEVDAAGHLQQIVNKGDDFITLQQQDIWKYNPKDYMERWHKSQLENPKLSDKITRMIQQSGLKLLDRVGTPIITKGRPLMYKASDNVPGNYTQFLLDKVGKSINWKISKATNQLPDPPTEIFLKQGGTIHIKPENKGKFTATKKATGKSTEELTHSKNPITKKRAIFAQNSAKWKHQEGGIIKFQQGDSIFNTIKTRWPAVGNIKNLVIKADTNMNSMNTGQGDIETFQPKYNTTTYPNGFKYNNPNPGGNAVVYNPKTNTQDDIQLDLLHTLRRDDPVYQKHLSEFTDAYKNSDNSNRVKYWWDKKFSKQPNDGYQQYFENEVDGSLRNLLAPQSDKELLKQNYLTHGDAEKEVLVNPELNKRFDQLKNYLEIGKSYVLPEVTITGKKLLPKTKPKSN